MNEQQKKQTNKTKKNKYLEFLMFLIFCKKKSFIKLLTRAFKQKFHDLFKTAR